jgi:dihydrofolate reductase
MRKLIVLTFVSLDGVMQAPGGPQEDPSGGFKFGGWLAPFFDEAAGNQMSEQMTKPFDLLLGRKTFEIFAGYWPQHADEWPGINEATKNVASKTMSSHNWQNSAFIKGDVLAEVKKLKQQDGPALQVHGSANLLQTLWQSEVVDELWLKTFPVMLGKGKRLFEGAAMPTSFELTKHWVSPTGVIFANYKRAGAVEVGSVG